MSAIAPRWLRALANDAPTRGGWIAFAGIALVANVIWEVSQMPLYNVDFRFLRCVQAAFGDVLILVMAAALALLATRRRRRWFLPVLVMGLVTIAAAIEGVSLAAERWAYEDTMPTIAGIGLTPLVQLPLVGALAARLTLRRPRRQA